MRLTTTGRRTGRARSVIVGYFDDGPNLITLAMNGWADGELAWWLNLQAHPDATVELADGPRPVTARAAEGGERARLWTRRRGIGPKLDSYAALCSSDLDHPLRTCRTPEDLAQYEHSLNNRPRKTLGHLKPSDRLAELLALTA